MEQMKYWRPAARFVRAFAAKLIHGHLAGRLIVLAAALSCTAALPAQSTGSVQGRVYNIGNGKYLNNVRITVEGTNVETFTNDYGEYRLGNLPVGEARIRAEFTGLDTETITVNIAAGEPAQLDFNLTSRSRYGEDKTIVLDTFTVAASREFEGNAMATNEQRYAPNVKVVMAADAFGDVTEGNVGEFLKYLPGITVDYVAADVRTVSVRGFADNFTNVSIDGMRTTSSVSGNNNRVFEFEQVSINNVSRIEVTKVPTPSAPADSLGGNVNMISKNAFERKGAQFNYRAYLSFNSEDMDIFKKTPGPGNKSTYKAKPGFDFDYTLPFSKNFGIVITGLSSNQFNEQHRWQPTYNYAQAGATAANPYLQQFQLQDGPKQTFRDSISVKADWKITDNQVVSVSVQNNYYKSFFGNRNINFNIGTNSTAATTTGTALIWGQDFVQSATGTITAATGFGNRANVTQTGSFRDKLGNTAAVNATYRYNGDLWNVDAGVHGANSRTWYRDLSRGQFSAFSTQLVGVAQVRAENIDFMVPDMDWRALNTAGQPIDYNNLANYKITTTRSQPVDGKATMRGGYVNVAREIDAFSSPLTISAGVAVRSEVRDNRRYQLDYTYLGPDGVANSADDYAGALLDAAYSGEDPYFGAAPIQWGDPYALAAVFKQHPEYFREGTGTNLTGVQSETFRIANSVRVQETVSAAYVQLEGKLFNNRLHYVTGVRFERTEDEGEGPLINPDAVWQRNADGTYVDGSATTAGVQRVRKVEAGLANSLEQLKITNIERGYKATPPAYDGYYPSLHLTWDLSDDVKLRFAYAKTLGRPDYTFIVPTTTINEDDNNPELPGTITVSNTRLQPWTADNYELSLEYYFGKGGVASIGAFQKDLSNFWSTVNGPLTADLAAELGVDDRYVGWTVTSRINSGAAKISGLEYNYVRSLDFLPGWGRFFSVSSNGTMLHLEGPKGADFARFISKTGNLSLSWNKRPISARVTFNYRGRQRNSAQTGAQYGATGNFYEYYDSRYNIDTNFEYTFSKRYKLFFNARNILNQPQVLERYNESSLRSVTGYRHEEFGVQFSLGLKGTW